MSFFRRCVRCQAGVAEIDVTCPECGVNLSRPVRRMRRRASIGGKRGRNSGTTGTAKNKK